jgi:hypothetical protein
MTNFDPEEVKKKLVGQLMKFDIDETEAQEMAKREVERMGVYRTNNGSCPRGCDNVMACMFCPTGHTTECHYPYSCEEANCGHYQTQLAKEEVE